MSTTSMTDDTAAALSRDRMSFDQIHALLGEMLRIDAESVDLQWLPHSTVRASLSRDDEDSFAWVGTISPGGTVRPDVRIMAAGICPKCHGAGELTVNRSRNGDPQRDESVPCGCDDGQVIL